MVEDADVVMVAYGTTSRIARNAVNHLRKEGIKAGLIRLKTLWPYPTKAFENLKAKHIICSEMSMGQMVEDVKIAVECKMPVHFVGRTGGMVPDPMQIVEKARELVGGTK